jgi:hypothetical protein
VYRVADDATYPVATLVAAGAAGGSTMHLLVFEILFEAERDVREAQLRAAVRRRSSLLSSPSPPHPVVAAGASRAGRLLIQASTRVQAMCGIPDRTLWLAPDSTQRGAS